MPKATRESTERVVFIPDVHVPYHDPALVTSALNLTKHVSPHRVVLLGDLYDFHSISRWNVAQERLDSLQEELDQGTAILSQIRKVAPNADLRLTLGNHDERLRKYVMVEGRALASLRTLDFTSLIRAREYELNVHEGHGFLLRPNFLVRHGTMIRKGAGASAKAEAMSAGVNGISGHTHRLGTYRLSGYGSVQWTEAGTLSRVDPPYVLGVPDHQQGMAIGHFSTRSKSFVIEEVQVIDGNLWYGGRSY